MEPLRPTVDRIVLDFLREHTFTPSDFELTDRGVCRLHPQMARRFIEQVKVSEDWHDPVRLAVSGLSPHS
jgi:CRISPR/Cas system-associated endonuclease Cas1